MPRYRYIPINYDDYLSKYKDTLKTGELLTDLTNHDIYVTEEGYNIPIPTTKDLRDVIVNFLETDLEGIKLHKEELPSKLNNLYKLKEQIEEQQTLVSNNLHELDATIPTVYPTKTIIRKITEKNINQLGDLNLNLDSIKDLDNKDKIIQVVNDFNTVNASSQSLLFDSTSTANNNILIDLWNELTSLMATAKSKLDSLGTFQGTIQLSSNSTERKKVYDIQYSRRLYNWSNTWGISSESGYIIACGNLESNFGKWLRGEAYKDIPYTNMFKTGGKGTGLFYKNFPNKYNYDLNSYAATKYNAWDLFEGLPTSDFKEKSKNGFHTYDYIFSTTNRAFPDYETKGTYANEANFTHRLDIHNATSGVKFGGGAAKWRQPVRMNPSAYTNDSLLDIISTVDSTGMQRLPRSTKTNAKNKVFSNQAPTVPTITRAVKYRSSRGYSNADGLVIRLGVQKQINITKIGYKKYTLNNNSGWKE